MKKFFIIIVLFLLSAGAYFWINTDKNSQAQISENSAPPPTEVTTVTVRPQEIEIQEEFPGRTSAFKMAEIRPQVSGIITERLFTEGSTVSKGDQLYQIDPAPYQAAYKKAEADLQSAKANVTSVESREKRYAELVEIDAVSHQEYDDIRASLDQARAAVAVAEAAVAVAKVDLDYTRVYAPISGQIGKSNVTEGALVTANQPETLTRITRLDPIYVDLTVPSGQLMRIRAALNAQEETPVRLHIEAADTTYPFDGVLQFSDVTVDETTGSVQLRTLFPNPDTILLPGMFVRAEIGLGRQEALLVPQQAAIRDADGNLSVWIVQADNTVSPVTITVEDQIDNQWIVSEGVTEGDILVTEGFQKIQPGSTVALSDAPSDEVPEDQEPATPETSDTPESEAQSEPEDMPEDQE